MTRRYELFPVRSAIDVTRPRGLREFAWNIHSLTFHARPALLLYQESFLSASNIDAPGSTP